MIVPTTISMSIRVMVGMECQIVLSTPKLPDGAGICILGLPCRERRAWGAVIDLEKLAHDQPNPCRDLWCKPVKVLSSLESRVVSMTGWMTILFVCATNCFFVWSTKAVTSRYCPSGYNKAGMLELILTRKISTVTWPDHPKKMMDRLCVQGTAWSHKTLFRIIIINRLSEWQIPVIDARKMCRVWTRCCKIRIASQAIEKYSDIQGIFKSWTSR